MTSNHLKLCRSCNRTKPSSEFGSDRSNKDGLTNNCRECKNAKQRAYAKINGLYEIRNDKNREYRKSYYSRPEVMRRVRSKQLLKSFGITIEEYDRILSEQGGVCAVCRGNCDSRRNKNLAVDHDHQTGKVRGILCSRCNRAIGLLGDSVNVLRNAISYLMESSNAD